MEKHHTTKQLFRGALLLTFAGLISKVLSAGYRVPLQNITGDVGFYIYQQIYPFLGIALMLSLYGLPTAISKVVSEQSKYKKLSIPSFYIPVVSLLYLTCVCLFAILFCFAPQIASWMGDSNLESSLRVGSLIFFIVPLVSLIRGVFQGLNNMKPTALSQIIEQLIRVAVIILIAIVVARKGQDFYQIGVGAAFASIAGTMVTLLFLLYLWLKNKPFNWVKHPFKWLDYSKSIIFYGFLISINHMILLLFQLSDAFTLVPNLLEYGYNVEEAKVWKGVFDRGYPLIQLGTVIGSSLAIALIPQVTKTRLEKSPNVFKHHIQSVIKLSLYLSAGATVGLILIFPEVNKLLFQDAKGNASLIILTCTILLASQAITIATVLQGLDYGKSTAVFIVIAFMAKYGLNAMLIPQYGITGSAIGTVLSAGILLLLNISKLKRVIPTGKLLVLPIRAFSIAIAVMALFLICMDMFIFDLFTVDTRLEHLVYILVTVSVGALLYFTMLIIYDGFNEEEIQAFPFGHVLLEWRQRRSL